MKMELRASPHQSGVSHSWMQNPYRKYRCALMRGSSKPPLNSQSPPTVQSLGWSGVHVQVLQLGQVVGELRGQRAAEVIAVQTPALTTPPPHSAPPHTSLLAPTTQTLSTIQHPWTCLSTQQAEWAHPTSVSLGWGGEGSVHVHERQCVQLAQLRGHRASQGIVFQIPALTTPSPHSAPPHISLLAPTTQTLSTTQHP